MPAYTGPLEQVSPCVWKIPKSYREDMRVDGLIFADDELIEQIKNDQGPEQVVNVATLIGTAPSFTLTNAGNTYSGGTVVSGGTLTFTASSTTTQIPAPASGSVTGLTINNATVTETAATSGQQIAAQTVAINGSGSVVFAQTFGPAIPFFATVTGTTNTSVLWQVNGVTGGSATTGGITAADA